MPRNPLVVAADVSDLTEAEALATRLADRVAYVKIGLELFTAAGPEAVRRIGAHAPIFLDLKLHDIPNTVERAAANVARLGVGLLTVHAIGGPVMVAAAVRGARAGAQGAGAEPPAILAVTVLSSQTGEGSISAPALASLAVEAGADGVVASGDAVREVRDALGSGPLIVVPGIRPLGHGPDDQVRVLTPAEALERGANLIVVGRPVVRAHDPAAAVDAILREVGAA
jgi:orotidine-5'-phosphate decarboxylase